MVAVSELQQNCIQQFGLKPILFILSNWWLHFFNDDPVGLIPAGPGVHNTFISITSTNAESNSHFPRRNSTTVALYVGRPVYIHSDALVYDSINGGRLSTLFAVEGEVPSAAAG